MNGPVFRICVLLLTLLMQAGGFRSEASSPSPSCRVSVGGVTVPAVQDFDISEANGSEELSPADEAPGVDVRKSAALDWSRLISGCTAWPVSDELPPGRSPSGAPFKPPRA
jgi:hypothetical protein